MNIVKALKGYIAYYSNGKIRNKKQSKSKSKSPKSFRGLFLESLDSFFGPKELIPDGIQDQGSKNFENDIIQLSFKEAKLTGLGTKNCATIQQVLTLNSPGHNQNWTSGKFSTWRPNQGTRPRVTFQLFATPRNDLFPQYLRSCAFEWWGSTWVWKKW